MNRTTSQRFPPSSCPLGTFPLPSGEGLFIREGQSVTQTERILGWLKSHESINKLDAYQQLGITELSRRILDLDIKLGKKLTRRWVEVYNRHGEIRKVVEYRL